MGEGETDGLVWTLDTGHFPDPVTRWSSHLYTTTQTAIIAGLMAETGALVDSVASRELDGRVYTALVPLGGRVRPPSPRWLVPILCRTTPLLRHRLAAAHTADVTDWSGQVVADWYGGKEDELLERGRGFLAGDLTALTSAQVAARLEEQRRFVEDSLAWHFRLHVAGADAIGRLGLELTQHGWTALEVMDLFTGLSAATTDPAEAQRAIAERVREVGAIDALDAAGTLADVAATSRSVAAALQAYQARWGQRAVRYEVAHPTIVERPDWLLRQLKAAARAPAGPTDLAARHEAARTRAEARLIATLGNSSLTRRRLARAQRAFPLRDGNETATIGVPIAGLRRLGLHISERLGLHRPEDAFDLTFNEVAEALRQPESGSGAASLALPRREERERLAAKVAPPVVGRPADGAPAPNPDLRGYPRAPAEQLAALLWYIEQISGPPSRAASVDHAVRGLGVSPGICEGTARVIRDEDDFEHLEPGDVMVCPNTSPAWSVVFPSIGALVCDGGGALSHPAIAARELAIPAVVATGNATATIIDGTRIRVDGKSGEVTLLG